MNCPSYQSCSAPLCPEDLTEGIWYPDEEICGANNKNQKWIKQQRKIKKKAKSRELYFTLAMLERNSKILVGTKGINPDGQVDEKQQIKNWLAKRPLRKEMTQAQKQEISKRLNKN